MGKDWSCDSSDILVPASRVTELEAAFKSAFKRTLAEEMKEHGWEPQWDEDEEPIEGPTSLVGLYQIDNDPTFLTDEFEKALKVLSPFLEGRGVLELSSDRERMLIIMESGEVEFRRLLAVYIDKKDPDDIEVVWESLTKKLLEANRDPELLKRKIDESSCGEVVAA